MITKEKLALLQQAAKIVEADGLGGINTATNLVGEELALALLIAHLRIDFGSRKGYPADPLIDDKVTCIVTHHNLAKRY